MLLKKAIWLVLAAALFAGQVTAAQERAVPQSATEVQLSYAPVVGQVAPAVVNVYSKRVVRSRSRFEDDPFWGRFFGNRSRQRVQQSLGSGVIVGSDGIIVTNNHVIEGGQEFTVVLPDRREFDAELLLAEERTDLAVLRIDTKGERLPNLQFADSDEALVGDIVLAIGNPFGVGQTVTSGIVSAVARTRVGISDYQFFIQTDAAINPGNSGGALVNMSGDLLGVNTAIFSRSGGSNGIGFAIPANMVKGFVETATSGKALVRPWLGIRSQQVTSEIAESLDLDRPMGILINSVYQNGPIGQAGLKVGDIIIKVDDFDILDPQGLNYRVATKGIGSTVTLSYIRNGQTKTANVALVAPPETPRREETVLEGQSPLFGVTVVNLSPAVAEELGLDWGAEGVVIMEVKARTRARRYGLRAGDIITSINGNAITSVEDLKAEIKDPQSRWTLRVQRGNQVLSMTVSG